jgi:hypothetical protein
MPAGGENAMIARYFELPRSHPSADLKPKPSQPALNQQINPCSS